MIRKLLPDDAPEAESGTFLTLFLMITGAVDGVDTAWFVDADVDALDAGDDAPCGIRSILSR